MITVLAGGVGAARFLEGLAAVMPPEQITVIANTGDDAQFHGLHVSPDMDIVMYTLAGIVDRERGWGISDDTFHCLQALERLREETWFQLGDRDLATHLRRTARLRAGATLTEVTAELCHALGVAARILPMSNDLARTRLRTSAGTLAFQEYFVKLRQQPEVLEADFCEAAAARPAPDVLDAIRKADGIIIAPSNPILSIGPILAVPGIREALRNTPAPVAAISPIVGGRALKGPADRILSSLGLGASALAVAKLYRDILNLFIMDCEDIGLENETRQIPVETTVTRTVMNSPETKQQLAQVVLRGLQRGGRC